MPADKRKLELLFPSFKFKIINKTMKKKLTIEQRIKKAAYDKQYQQDHKAEIAIRKRRYYQENKDKVIKYQQDHRTEIATCEKRRRANNIGCRLKINIRNGVRQSIKGTKQYKHSIDLLGCTIPEVRNHLERQFKPGMSWDNWGTHGWHIDHIIPLDYFNFADPEQQKRAWHYTNLQPLWATDNLKKHNKVEERQLVLL